MKPVLLDSGVIVAALDRTDEYHAICAAALQNLAEPLLTCEAVIVESCHLLRRLRGARQAVLQSLIRGVVQLPFVLAEHAGPLVDTLNKYKDQGIDLADGCLIQMATALETGEILTLDSDFKFYRWGRNRAFRNVLGLW